LISGGYAAKGYDGGFFNPTVIDGADDRAGCFSDSRADSMPER
jgi:hypothetical protein